MIRADLFNVCEYIALRMSAFHEFAALHFPFDRSLDLSKTSTLDSQSTITLFGQIGCINIDHT